MAGLTTRQFGFKVKIVEKYEKLFEPGFHVTLREIEKEAFDFWKDFFLLKANPVELEKVINIKQHQCNSSVLSNDKIDQQNGHATESIKENSINHQHQTINSIDSIRDGQQIITLLFEHCEYIIDEQSNDKLKQLNSLLTLYVILMINMKQSKKPRSTNIVQLSKQQLQSLNERLMRLIDHYGEQMNGDTEMVKMILKLCLCIMCRDEELTENEFIEIFLNDRLFDQLFHIVCTSRKQTLSHLSLVIITLLQNYNNNSDNLFTIRLSMLDHEVALNAYAQVISRQLNNFNQQYRKEFSDQQANGSGAIESIFSALSGLVSSTASQNRNEPNYQFEQILLQTNHNSIILALYDIIRLNRNFIQFLLTNHSLNGDLKETNNLLINFLEFCSIIIFCLKEYFQRGESLQKKLIITTRPCFNILTCIVEDQLANSMIHDPNNISNKVLIHRSKIRHRKLEDSTVTVKRPIAYSILDLMIEFLFSNLRKKHFPIDLYIFSNNIILKLLMYQIKFEYECRKEFSDWSILWHSLFSLLKHLVNIYDKSDVLLLKRRSRLLLLANNVVHLFNLFIIFGDTFLYSPLDYDNLYYELLRNHDIFKNLTQLAKHHSLSKKKDEKEAAIKVLDSLENIDLIVTHFINKINESKNDLPLSEDEIREIVRSNYETVTIKVKDGLDIYENYEPEKLFFKKKVLKKVIETVRSSQLTNLDELVNDQQIILQSILNC